MCLQIFSLTLTENICSIIWYWLNTRKEGVVPVMRWDWQSGCVLPLAHCGSEEVERDAHLFPKHSWGFLGKKEDRNKETSS